MSTRHLIEVHRAPPRRSDWLRPRSYDQPRHDLPMQQKDRSWVLRWEGVLTCLLFLALPVVVAWARS